MIEDYAKTMREFKNSKAIELIKEAQALEDYVALEEDRLKAQGLPLLDYYCELLTEAAGLRVLADDIEAGRISESELEDA